MLQLGAVFFHGFFFFAFLFPSGLVFIPKMQAFFRKEDILWTESRSHLTRSTIMNTFGRYMRRHSSIFGGGAKDKSIAPLESVDVPVHVPPEA